MSVCIVWVYLSGHMCLSELTFFFLLFSKLKKKISLGGSHLTCCNGYVFTPNCFDGLCLCSCG